MSGCSETARQKILSILHHTSNSHHFPSYQKFPQCEHEDLDSVKRPWIEPGSVAMTKLRNAICGENNRNLDDLEHMTGVKVYLVFVNWNMLCSLINWFAGGWTKQNLCSDLVNIILFSEFVHTSEIESLNNLRLKYSNKKYSYRYIFCILLSSIRADLQIN